MRSAMQSDKKGLTARDLVTCGVFIALYFVFMMVGSMLFAPNPVLGVVADLIAGAGRFRNKNLNLVSFLVFSLNPMGSYLMLWIDPSGYTSYLAGKGTEQAYLDTMVSTGAGWVLPGMIALTLVCALVSALVGRRLLKKQFEKAGVTA